ncbi:hypothetical protein SAMN05443377_102129 [Propionibacterium cyclohexanicum]|uniref:CBU-0592-like domain-containing protein n=1 Tax=Propionibacterium cyclohexanicum TaxID=64702 RepID=A0A1H9Q6D5_9ACTN|nr:hypothetical protein SAMN05443377_102129 [Propionibacterium cyclohexanicum]
MTTVVAMALGWIGAAGTLAAYYLVSSERVRPDSVRFHVLNMAGCLLLAFACFTTRAWPSLVTNLVFLAIGLRMVWQLRARILARLRRGWRHRGQRAPHSARDIFSTASTAGGSPMNSTLAARP